MKEMIIMTIIMMIGVVLTGIPIVKAMGDLGEDREYWNNWATSNRW